MLNMKIKYMNMCSKRMKIYILCHRYINIQMNLKRFAFTNDLIDDFSSCRIPTSARNSSESSPAVRFSHFAFVFPPMRYGSNQRPLRV